MDLESNVSLILILPAAKRILQMKGVLPPNNKHRQKPRP